MITVEVIPYKSFKEKLRLTKEIKKQGKVSVEVYPTYLYIEKHTKGDN